MLTILLALSFSSSTPAKPSKEPPKAKIGAECKADTDCESGTCSSGKCAAPAPKPQPVPPT